MRSRCVKRLVGTLRNREGEMMVKTGLRVVALFGVYASIGSGGDFVAGLLATQAGDDLIHVNVAPAPAVAVDVAPSVVVDVRPTVVSRVQVRHSGECSFRDERRLVSPASGVTSVEIDAGAGSLHVEGQEGIEEIVIVGMLCASAEENLEHLQVTVDGISNGAVRVVTHYPTQRRSLGNNTARIDLTVLVPLGMDVSIEDASGDLTVLGVGNARIDDSSGSVEVVDILGSLRLDDGSGGVRIRGVAGDAVVDDGSGGLEVQDVRGSVILSDGSGGIDIVGVGRDVLIESDGSGSIAVTDVVGDFTVQRNGNGSIRHSGVGGRLDVPARRRRGG